MSKHQVPVRHNPYARAFAGSEDDFPTYVLKVLGRDRSWMDNGSCRGHDLARKRAWTVRPAEKVHVGDVALDGKELIQAALSICRTCPAQYQCAMWAYEVREESGTWAMEHDHLLWLTRQEDGAGIINLARAKGTPVQVAVQRTMSKRRREHRARLREGVASAS